MLSLANMEIAKLYWVRPSVCSNRVEPGRTGVVAERLREADQFGRCTNCSNCSGLKNRTNVSNEHGDVDEL